MSQIVRIHEYGNADVLRIDNIDVPAPAADEVQIRVKAIGLNRAEVMFRNGAYLQEAQFPSRLGYEAAGVVEAVGSAVSGFTTGDAVSVVPPLDIARWGTYGELANVPARLVVKHPQALDFETAAAVWMQYVTAWGRCWSRRTCPPEISSSSPLPAAASDWPRSRSPTRWAPRRSR